MKIKLLFFAFLVFATSPLFGQGMEGMEGMDHSHMHHGNTPQTFLPGHFASGTSLEPRSSPEWMTHKRFHGWNIMFHGQLFLAETMEFGEPNRRIFFIPEAVGPDFSKKKKLNPQVRLQDRQRLFSTNWFMIEASRPVKGGELAIGVMPTLEPLTVTRRQYPLLFQTGETAFGKPIMNGQHPHDGIMAVYARYTHAIGARGTGMIYCAPVGDPALGSPAFPHALTASEFPEARITHHWIDSSHVSFSVCTLGFAQKRWMVEASMFHGREPDEYRWTISPGSELGTPDSWSGRFTFSPNDNWVMQVSHGHITAPEAPLEAGDVDRTTASAIYNKQFKDGNWATTAIWGMNHERLTRENSHAFVLETNLQFHKRNYISGRIESVEKRGLLLTNGLKTRPTAFTAGFARDIYSGKNYQAALGIDASFYALQNELHEVYGAHPLGLRFFLRFRIGSEMRMGAHDMHGTHDMPTIQH